MTSVGAADLMDALCALHDRFGCERSSASFRLADDTLMTVSLDGPAGDLTIVRDAAGEPPVVLTAQAAPTAADIRALQRRRRR